MPSETSTGCADQSVEELRRELAEAHEQQATTAEILKVISSAPMDSQRVFAEIAASAGRLCDASDAAIHQVDGEVLRLVASHGSIAKGDDTLPLTREVVTGRAVLDRHTIQVADVQAETGEYPVGSANARRLGHRTLLAVPLMRSGQAIGVIGIRRTEVRPFSDRQIDLLKTFADQAVIAIENARLFQAEEGSKRELQESLDYQTATSEVLSVISRSPNDVQPVFDTIARIAQRLCQAEHAFVLQRGEGGYRLVAANDAVRDWVIALKANPLLPDRGSLTGRVALERRTVHVDDLRADPEYTLGPALQHGVRSELGVPLKRDGEVIGVIIVGRTEVRPFTKRQIALVETFADQAVIAIENARLFEAEQASKRELSESLQRQTGTADVLKVISRSAFDLQSVLNALTESAARLCRANRANIARVHSDSFEFVAFSGFGSEYSVYMKGLQTSKVDRGSITGRAVMEGSTVHVRDVLADPEFTWFEAQKRGGFRTALGVPLVREGTPIGVFFLTRSTVAPFTQQEIDLVSTFADQAVIAIENARLFEDVQASKRELQESLEYQTAMREVLEVISRSPNQLQPVLETIVQTAQRLCEGDRAQFFTLEQGKYHLKAHVGTDPEFLSYLSENPIPADSGSGSTTVKAARERRTIHVPDTLADAEFSTGDLNRAGRGRSALAVPLLRGDLPIGVITVARDKIKPFTPAQIALIETFADQAVIAIENTRLFEAEQASKRELQESLDRQTATAEVLGVISRSPNEAQPVLDTIVSTARRLCRAERAAIWRLEGETFRAVAHHGQSEELVESVYSMRMPVSRGSMLGRATFSRRAVQVEDVATDAELVAASQAFSRASNVHTVLAVPLLLKGQPIGVISLTRTRVAPFDDKQVTLVESFADQAVIAIENARLFEAEQASKRELARSVEELESLGKVSQAVNSSLELDKVLPTILEHACAMSYAGSGTVFEFDKTTSEFRLAAAHNMSDEHIAMVRTQPMRLNSVVVGECATRREVVQVADLSRAVPSPLLDVLLRTGVRAVLAVPLLHQAEVVGVLVVRRNQPGIFSPEIIRLVEAFAAQSAIAVENARLFGEIAHKSRELEIASQHKSQFVANMSHELRTPLAAILGYAELMQEGFYEPQGPKALDALMRIRSNGKHLLGLINTVLDIAKIESGQFTLNMSEYAIESVVETVRSATESLAQNKKLALKTEVAKSLPIGLGDEQRLTQVLLNLVGNAIKFTDTGEVRVTAKTVNGHFNVSVTDTGPGIPVEHQARIFEQFHQVDSSNTKAKGGTGLGLAIAKQIVEMHGGRIWVESTLGKGSTFQMELPTRAEIRTPAS